MAGCVRMRDSRWLVCLGMASLLACAQLAAQPQRQRDPASWGGDHVGKPVPEYVTGDECLFCHRADVGPEWTMNRHHRTIREADTESASLVALKRSTPLQKFAGEVKLLLGGNQHLRYLKPAKSYGK